jgi:ubiquinone/menaquinone biosynthesis C-methylase UbiE
VTFKDHFSGHARQYAEFRPTYPESLFATIASLAPGAKLAWDCATGNGQAALGLVRHVERVIATDASATQVANATPHERIAYAVARGEDAPLRDDAVDLVTIAQALHWLDTTRFFAEAARVLEPGGVFAAWGYGNPTVSPEIDPILIELYSGTLGPFWPAERRMIEEEYADLEIPFERIAIPASRLERAMTRDEFEGYLRTWSGTIRYVARHGTDPIAPAFARLTRWWDATEPRVVRWPLFFLVGRA